ncbi:MAG: YihY/virulence factor BrkB family protein [Spirochaetia bacterium]|nr:YihY/virulence factor BrkB family protein [Spirochaetia bacterium]
MKEEKEKKEKTKQPLKNKKQNIFNKIKKFGLEILKEEEAAADSAKKIAKNLVKGFIAAVHKFIKDEALIRATSVSYSLVISFIPALVVALIIGSKYIDKELVFLYAQEFLRKENIQIDLMPYKEVIDTLFQNANAIGGIGFMVMFFSATSVLRNLENALNKIWKVQKQRPFIQKISGFMMVMIFGPMLLALGISFADSLFSKFVSPDLNVIKYIEDDPVILGEKNVWLKRTGNAWQYLSVIDKVDEQAQKEPVIFNASVNKIYEGEEKEKYKANAAYADLSSLKTASFKDAAKIKNKIWLIADQGVMLYSKNNGKTWDVQKFWREDIMLFEPSFNKIKMFDENRGVIIGKKGLILVTEDGGKKWRPNYHPHVRENFNDIVTINQDTLVIAGDSYALLTSKDSGKSWEIPVNFEATRTIENENLRSVYVLKDKIMICGDQGVLLTSSDAGVNWQKKRLGARKYDFNKILFINAKKGLIAGEDGIMAYTKNGGYDWHFVDSKITQNINDIFHIAHEKKIYAVADAYHILAAHEDTFYDFNIAQKSPFWRQFISAVANFILPFFVIWIVIFLVYKVIPYTQISGKAAGIGAAAASLMLVLFSYFLKFIPFFFKGTIAIYGTLAAIPIGLLLVYAMILIVLFGAETAFFVQYPYMARLSLKQMTTQTEKKQIWYGFKVLQIIFEDFEKGRGKVKETKLLKACGNNEEELEFILNALEKRSILQRVDNIFWMPSSSAKNIYLKDLIELLDKTGFEIPAFNKNDKFMKASKEIFQKIKNQRVDVVKDATFEDMIK